MHQDVMMYDSVILNSDKLLLLASSLWDERKGISFTESVNQSQIIGILVKPAHWGIPDLSIEHEEPWKLAQKNVDHCLTFLGPDFLICKIERVDYYRSSSLLLSFLHLSGYRYLMLEGVLACIIQAITWFSSLICLLFKSCITLGKWLNLSDP